MSVIRRWKPCAGLLLAGMVGLLGLQFSALAQEAATQSDPTLPSESAALSAASQPATVPTTHPVAVTSVSADSMPATETARTVDPVAAALAVMQDMGLTPEDLVLDYPMVEYTTGNSVTLPISVLTEDGSPPPTQGELSVETASMFWGTMVTLARMDAGMIPVTPRYGTSRVLIDAEGWAPLLVGPIRTSAEKMLSGQSFVLSRGISCKVHVIDPQGKPVPEVKVSLEYPMARTIKSLRPVETSADGLAVLEHAPAGGLEIKVAGEGWYPQSRHWMAENGQTMEIHLSPRPMLRGTVLQGEDGKPIAGAEVYVMERGDDVRWYMLVREAKPVATTNDQGEFQAIAPAFEEYHLTILTPDKRALNILWKEGMAHEIRMPRPLYVRGHIKGDLSGLYRDGNGKPILQWNNRNVVMGDLVNPLRNISYQSVVSSNNGKYEYEIFPLFPGPLEIMNPAGKQELFIEKAIDDLEIDLGSSNPAVPTGSGRSMNPSLLDMPVAGLFPMFLGGQLESFSSAQAKHELREVVVKFDPPRGVQALAGFVVAMGVETGAKPVEVKDNQAKLDFPNGRDMGLLTMGMPGIEVDTVSIYLSTRDGAQDVSAELKPGGSVRVKVVDQDGQPAEFQQVLVARSDFTSILKVGGNDALSAFVTSPKAPEEHFITGLPLGVPMKFIVPGRRGGSCSESIVLTRNQPVRELTITLDAPRDYTIHLRDMNGQPMPGQKVKFVCSDRSSLYEEILYADGKGDVYIDQVLSNRSSCSLLIEGISGSRPMSVPLRDVTEQIVQMQPGLKLAGKVIQADTHRPVINAEVMAKRMDDHHESVQGNNQSIKAYSNDQGEFVFEVLEPGKYHLDVAFAQSVGKSANDRSPDGEIIAEPGQKEPVLIEIKASFPDAPFPYPLGEILAKQPIGSATQPAGQSQK